MAFVITPSGQSAIPFTEIAGNPSFYNTAGRYIQTIPRLNPWKYRITTNVSPGSPYRFTKRFGKDTRLIDRIILHYVQTSVANITTAYDTDVGLVFNTPCALQLPGRGSTYDYCECTQFDMIPSSRGLMIQKIATNLYRAQCVLKFEQLRA